MGLGALPVDLDPVLRGRWPPYARGPALSVAIQNGYAFVAAGEGGHPEPVYALVWSRVMVWPGAASGTERLSAFGAGPARFASGY